MHGKILYILRVFVLIGMTRSKVDFECIGRHSAGKCTYCAYGYINEAGKCQEPQVTLLGCYYYEADKKCFECS